MRQNARFGVVLLAIIILMTLRVTEAKAQDKWVAANGTYKGPMVMSGTYSISPEAFGGQGIKGDIDWVGDGHGPLEITIVGGTGNGTWEIKGDALIGGSVENEGVLIDVEGEQTFGSQGELSGDFSRYVAIHFDKLLEALQNGTLHTIALKGESFGESTVTVNLPQVASQTVTDDYRAPAEAFLYYQGVSCTQIQGGWIEEPEAVLEAAGFKPDLEGSWSVVREDVITSETDELQNEIARLLKQSIELRDQMNQCQMPGWADLTNFLRDIHRLLQSIKKDLACEITPNQIRYLYPVTYAACSALGSLAFNNNCADNSYGNDFVMLQYATLSLGCLGQDFYTEGKEQSYLAKMEEQMLKRLASLDLSSDADKALLLQIADTADIVGLDNVFDAAKEVHSNYRSGGGK